MVDNYTQNFYDIIRPGCQKSASIVVPIVMERIKPKRVIDIGCGEGWWAYEFKKEGCEVLGIDGDYVASSPLESDFMAADISQPFPDLGQWDLVVCLEVAEHLPVGRAATFIDDLCKLAPVILFSAAIPKQPGAGHINCQWPTWWERYFNGNGFRLSGSIRDIFWDNDDIEPWYRQNLMIATKSDVIVHDYDLNRIHPIIKGWMK